ncbi:MAG: VOC family protein [Thermoplasmata archaeon]
MKALAWEWIGTRTDAFLPTIELFRDVLGVPVGVERRDFVRMDLPDGGSLEVFRPGGPDDHPYFTTGPVVGIQVGDFDAARLELERGGAEMLGNVGGTAGEYRWQHFRAPDGDVYEIVDDPVRDAFTAPSAPRWVTGFGWVGVRTPEFAPMREFARTTLGLRLVEDAPDLAVFEFPGGHVLELFRPGGPLDHPHLVTGPLPGLLVTDLDGCESALRAHRIEILQRRRFGPAGWSHFRAPDGNAYEIKRF